LSAISLEFGKPLIYVADLNKKVFLNADIKPPKKDRPRLPLFKAILKPTLIRVTAFDPAF
jgi:hypothetical protein